MEEVVPKYNLIAGSMYHDTYGATKYFCVEHTSDTQHQPDDSCECEVKAGMLGFARAGTVL